MLRLTCLFLIFELALADRIAAGAESAEVNLDYVAQRALERAQKPFHSPRADLPKVLRQDNLDYDKYREIRFRRDQAHYGLRMTCPSASSFFIRATFIRNRSV
jgi:glucan biosynthesis protein